MTTRQALHLCPNVLHIQRRARHSVHCRLKPCHTPGRRKWAPLCSKAASCSPSYTIHVAQRQHRGPSLDRLLTATAWHQLEPALQTLDSRSAVESLIFSLHLRKPGPSCERLTVGNVYGGLWRYRAWELWRKGSWQRIRAHRFPAQRPQIQDRKEVLTSQDKTQQSR